eukprot:g11263.t1
MAEAATLVSVNREARRLSQLPFGVPEHDAFAALADRAKHRETPAADQERPSPPAASAVATSISCTAAFFCRPRRWGERGLRNNCGSGGDASCSAFGAPATTGRGAIVPFLVSLRHFFPAYDRRHVLRTFTALRPDADEMLSCRGPAPEGDEQEYGQRHREYGQLLNRKFYWADLWALLRHFEHRSSGLFLTSGSGILTSGSPTGQCSGSPSSTTRQTGDRWFRVSCAFDPHMKEALQTLIVENTCETSGRWDWMNNANVSVFIAMFKRGSTTFFALLGQQLVRPHDRRLEYPYLAHVLDLTPSSRPVAGSEQGAEEVVPMLWERMESDGEEGGGEVALPLHRATASRSRSPAGGGGFVRATPEPDRSGHSFQLEQGQHGGSYRELAEEEVEGEEEAEVPDRDVDMHGAYYFTSLLVWDLQRIRKSRFPHSMQYRAMTPPQLRTFLADPGTFDEIAADTNST